MLVELNLSNTDRCNCSISKDLEVKDYLSKIVISLVVASFNVQEEDLIAPTRCKAHIARVRQIAMYMTHICLGLSLTKVGNLFGRDRTTAAHACRVIEDMRDDPKFDQALECLEMALNPLLGKHLH